LVSNGIYIAIWKFLAEESKMNNVLKSLWQSDNFEFIINLRMWALMYGTVSAIALVKATEYMK